MNRIILIGPSGAGKTTCGQALAAALDYYFIDTDKIIESESGLSVDNIFQQFGEEHFRHLEHNLLDRLTEPTTLLPKGIVTAGIIVATGGGLPIWSNNFEQLKQLGKIVFLTANIDILLQRVQENVKRPLLKADRNESITNSQQIMREKLIKLLEARLSVYNQAQYKVETSDLNPNQVAQEVMKLLVLKPQSSQTL